VARLKLEFTTRAEALIHGDLHTGSIMVGVHHAPETKVIDAEFCFHGPIAFDLGVLIGNLLIARARAATTARERQRRWLHDLPAELWSAFADEFWMLWPHRADQSLTDTTAQRQLERIAHDAIGFAACEAIRRVVGFAQVADLETLPPRARARASATVLIAARGWLVDPAEQRAQLLHGSDGGRCA
jgi:5-methylthioribose kinase